MDVRFSGFGASNSAVHIVGAWADGKLQPRALAVNAELGGTLAAAMGRSRFNGQKGQWLEAQGPHGRVALAGLGAAGKLDASAAEAIGAGAVARYLTSGEKELAFAIEAQGKGAAPAELAVALALGASLRAYRFDKYRTKLKAEARPSLTTITVMTSDPKGAAKLWKDASALIDGVFLTRDLVSEPANVIYPESFAKKAQELKALGVEVEVLGEKEMKKLGMGALLGVGQGSAKESQLVVMQWKGAGKAPPVALVGKGVTFDTGGISLKPGDGMWDMKWDMGGAGAVIGAMKALAGRKAKANVVGVCGLVENMPDGDAQRPGDIVTSMSGQTIEVWNTDAEGRLVLADALHYTAERFKPAYMIDLATLTGAIMISLGVDMAGLFSNDDRLASMLEKAGKASGEPVWRLPLSESLDRALDSQCADMKNITGARNGGSIVGAMFLKRFVGETKWAHLDIAGVAWSGKAGTVAPEGATGFGVRLLDRLIQDNFER